MNELKDKNEQYKQFLNYTPPQQRGVTKSILSFLGVILVGFICAFAFFAVFVNHPKVNTEGEIKENIGLFKHVQKKEKKSFSVPIFNKRQNLLVLGVDSNGENTDKFQGTRSDTILLMNIDPSAHSINAISIPRDSKVYLADGSGVQKINHAHARGGVELTKKTIEETLGVKIDRYIIVNSDIVKELVDIIGGITVYVEKPLNYDDYAGKLHIHLDKGIQKLDGKQVEGFLRFRHDGLGDIGRTSRQQWFLKSLLDAIQSPSIIPVIPEALRTAMANIQTDMTLYELSHFAALMRDINMDSVEVATLPGGPSTKGVISYWILDPEKTQEMIDRMIYREKTENINNLSLSILHSEENKNAASELKSRLEELGYTVDCTRQTRMPHSQIIAHNKSASSDIISKIKRKVPELRGMQFVYDPTHHYCGKSDFTVVLSE